MVEIEKHYFPEQYIMVPSTEKTLEFICLE